MLVYITKPLTHECIMGGFRSLSLWTKPPEYHHYPQRYNALNKDEVCYVDKGWGVKNANRSAPAKPLLEQDEALSQKVWQYIVWSCCPKGINFEDYETWANTPSPAEERLQAGEFNNFTNMLYSRPQGKEADIHANINYKRFVLEVNIRTNEVKIITPHVHWYYGEKADKGIFHEQSLEIEPQYAKEIPYFIEINDPFHNDLPF